MKPRRALREQMFFCSAPIYVEFLISRRDLRVLKSQCSFAVECFEAWDQEMGWSCTSQLHILIIKVILISIIRCTVGSSPVEGCNVLHACAMPHWPSPFTRLFSQIHALCQVLGGKQRGRRAGVQMLVYIFYAFS